MTAAFNLSTLTPAQREVIEACIARCSYDFARCLPALRRDWGKTAIDVAFSDLSRFATAPRGSQAYVSDLSTYSVPATRMSGDHELGHVHVTGPGEGVEAHGIEVRHRVLGLAWSNGKIELDASLESDVELAHEVFLSEVAHEVDWFDPAIGEARKPDPEPGRLAKAEAQAAFDWFTQSQQEERP